MNIVMYSIAENYDDVSPVMCEHRTARHAKTLIVKQQNAFDALPAQ